MRQTAEEAKKQSVPGFEKYLFEKPDFGVNGRDYDSSSNGNLEALAQALVKYIVYRGDEARPLAGKMADRIDDYANRYKNPANVSYGSPEADSKEKKKKQDEMKKLASDLRKAPFDKAIGKILSPGVHPMLDVCVLEAKLSLMPADKTIASLLDKACAANSQEEKKNIMGQFLLFITVNKDLIRKNPVKQDICAEQWKKLIQPSGDGKDGSLDVSGMFLAANEELFAPRKKVKKVKANYSYECEPKKMVQYEAALALIGEYGQKGRQLLMERVQGRLSGVSEDKLSKYPCDYRLSQDELKGINDKLASVSSRKELGDCIGKFSIYQMAGLSKVLKQDTKLNARLAEFANTVIKVDFRIDDPEWKDKFNGLEGEVFSDETAKLMFDFCRVKTEKGVGVVCQLKRKKMLQGCELVITGRKENVANVVKEKSSIEGFTGLVFADGLFSSVAWRTSPMPKEKDWGTLLSSEGNEIAEFWKSIKEFSGSGGDASSIGMIRFVTKRGIAK